MDDAVFVDCCIEEAEIDVIASPLPPCGTFRKGKRKRTDDQEETESDSNSFNALLDSTNIACSSTTLINVPVSFGALKNKELLSASNTRHETANRDSILVSDNDMLEVLIHWDPLLAKVESHSQFQAPNSVEFPAEFSQPIQMLIDVPLAFGVPFKRLHHCPITQGHRFVFKDSVYEHGSTSSCSVQSSWPIEFAIFNSENANINETANRGSISVSDISLTEIMVHWDPLLASVGSHPEFEVPNSVDIHVECNECVQKLIDVPLAFGLSSRTFQDCQITQGHQFVFKDSAYEHGSTSSCPVEGSQSIEVPLLNSENGHIDESTGNEVLLDLNSQFLALIRETLNFPSHSNILEYTCPCSYCGAKKFQRESKGFCCAEGKIKLASVEPPHDLIYLFTSSSEEASQFRTYVRTYNSLFSFTSIGLNYDKELSRRNNGVYSFRVHGQIHHYINELLPLDRSPSYLQLYFYDTDHELENRLSQSDRIRADVVQLIMGILRNNPYCVFFRSLSAIPQLQDQTILISRSPDLDQRVYNAPVVSQVAAIWVDNEDTNAPIDRNIIVQGSSTQKHIVSYFYGCYDPLQYPLLFPFGESGWHAGIKRVHPNSHQIHSSGESLTDPHAFVTPDALLAKEKEVLNSSSHGSRINVSPREYYCYKLQMRDDQNSIILQTGRLLQQFVVDMYIKVETSRLDYLRNNKKKIRSELYSGVIDSVIQGHTRGDCIGRRVILPPTFIGGPRDMKRRFSDAMALVQKLGKPDLFITMTCNPSWPEIKNCLGPNEEAQNRPDLLARVFRAKVEELKHDLFKKQIFGPVAGYVYVIEFQKRGLPHAHFLIILKSPAKIVSPTSFDYYVSAEIPPTDMPHLRAAVKRHMMHGPCGHLKPENVCMKDGHCKNYYPKEFCEKTTQGIDSYPIYRRRNNSEVLRVRGCNLDNRWVIPYNPYLLAKFDCHINVEICSTIKAVKYLYKYIFKGHDKVAFKLISQGDLTELDEIKAFQSGRWVGAPEAMWRIYGFTLNEISPTVVNLQLHLEDKHSVTFTDGSNLNSILNNHFLCKTMLTQFFELNRKTDQSRKYLYKEIPEHYVWNKMDREWSVRKKGVAIGRIVMANPNEGERYYLRLLLNHIRGPKSFDDLLTVDNLRVSSFHEAATLLGLLHSDNSIEACLLEASFYHMPPSLRRLFATILAYCNPVDPRTLWNKFELDLSEDFSKLADHEEHATRKKVLASINLILQSMGKDINEFAITDQPVSFDDENLACSREIHDEMNIPVTVDDLTCIDMLNYQQKSAYNTIMTRVRTKQPGVFFIDGPGGTGKTFLYRALLASVRSMNCIALATATSGVAASILPGGRTAHSRFKIPIDLEEHLTCSISKQSQLAKLIQQAALIVWDEASMARRQAVEAVDRMLQDIMNSSLLFGGKVIVFGGDFRQVLPVVPKSTRDEAIDASLVNSFLWPEMTVLPLTENMRARTDPDFCDFLIRVGNGTEPVVNSDCIKIPSNLLLPYGDNEETSLQNLIDVVYPSLSTYVDGSFDIIKRAILTPKNDFVDQINDLLIETFPGTSSIYSSRDECTDSENYLLEEDFLNSLTPSGYPPHRLVLKVGCPIILLRNIDPSKGLSNGTRLICRRFERNVIDAEIALGQHKGTRVFIPRIPLLPNKTDKYPFPFKRTQFPIKLSFAMTVNKAQGQTLQNVGIYLPQPVFSHGQLYVALSRATTADNLKVLIRPDSLLTTDISNTPNVVYTEILHAAHPN